MTVVEAVCALAVTVPVVFGVRDVPPSIDADLQLFSTVLMAFAALNGVLACTRLTWFGGEKQDFESAVPVADPGTVRRALETSLRQSFDWSSFVLLVVMSTAMGLILDPLMAFFPLLVVPERLVKWAYATYWERRHGVVLWRGHVPEQPLGKGQRLYSSRREPAVRH
ncbi:hypothetical protein [Streptomyces acidicola]|uniref:Uncharacterized protein n=1 Tax=Streptomyces acidicola TaxID=2596892 RepID=A0A5N8X0N9_9ACTN|nr:hypothetical protein [Streptomyces acidicola]MPY53157.1 hypothetical protein [Streptomyces acidicola]